jgi:hypothetical protein
MVLLGNLGISGGVLQLLQQGRSSISDLRKEARGLGIETEGFAKKNEALNDRLLTLKRIVAFALIPLRQEFMKMVKDWLPKFVKLVKRITRFLPQLAKLVGVLASLFVVAKIVVWPTAIFRDIKAVWGLVAAFKALAIAKGIGSAAGIAGAVGGSVIGGGAVGAGAGATVAAGAGALLPIAAILATVATGAFVIKQAVDSIKIQRSNSRMAAESSGKYRNFNNSENMTFNITGATDPKAVGREVAKVLDSRNRNTIKTSQSRIF